MLEHISMITINCQPTGIPTELQLISARDERGIRVGNIHDE